MTPLVSECLLEWKYPGFIARVEMSLSGLVCEKQTDNTLEVQAWDLFHM
jgi:hypothetical protein